MFVSILITGILNRKLTNISCYAIAQSFGVLINRNIEIIKLWGAGGGAG